MFWIAAQADDVRLAAMKASIGPNNLGCSALIFSSLHSYQRMAPLFRPRAPPGGAE